MTGSHFLGLVARKWSFSMASQHEMMLLNFYVHVWPGQIWPHVHGYVVTCESEHVGIIRGGWLNSFFQDNAMGQLSPLPT